MQTCLRAFLSSPTGAETLHYGIAPLGVPYYAEEFPLSEPLSHVSLIELAPLGAQALTYGLPSFEPMGG